MNAFWQSPLLVVVVLTGLAVPPRSLAEAAQREALRRQMTPKSRTVLTNLGQPPEIPRIAAVTPPPDEPPVTEPPVTEPPVVVPPVTPPPPVVEKKDEAWWRARITAAREAVLGDQLLAGTLQSRINVLQREVVNEDNPVKQGQLRQELKDKLEALDRANRKLAEDQKAVAAVQEDARRSDVPPGWIR